jgi:Zn-dependent protease
MASSVREQEIGTVSASPSRGTLRVLRLSGTEICVHWSWIILYAVLAGMLSLRYLPIYYPDWPGRQYWLTGTLTILAFLCVLIAAEMLRIAVARRYGVAVPRVTISLLGGRNSIPADLRDARADLAIALSRPAVTIGAAALAGLLWLAVRDRGIQTVEAGAGYLALLSLSLGIVRLLPIPPLDGGTALRALLQRSKRNAHAARQAAESAGTTAVLVLYGVAAGLAVSGQIRAGIWLAVLGWFLGQFAQRSRQEELIDALRGKTVADIYNSNVPTIPADDTVSGLLRRAVVEDDHDAFFVTTHAGAIIGLVSTADAARIPEEEHDAASVFRTMIPRERLTIISPDADLFSALRLMLHCDTAHLAVGADRDLVGVLSRSALLQAAEHHHGRPPLRHERSTPAR